MSEAEHRGNRTVVSGIPRGAAIARRIICVLATLALGLMMCGCEPQDPYARYAKLTGGRAAIAGALINDFHAGKLTFADALDAAHERLDHDPSSEATLFAASVLDLGSAVASQLQTGPEMEIMFWWRVGRLAFRAAEADAVAGRWKEARAVVLAGPERWQTEAYWRTYPDHDALAAIILAQNGERAEAIRRLKSRPMLVEPADEVLRELQTMR